MENWERGNQYSYEHDPPPSKKNQKKKNQSTEVLKARLQRFIDSLIFCYFLPYRENITRIVIGSHHL